MSENIFEVKGLVKEFANHVKALDNVDAEVKKGEVLFKDSGLSGIVVFNLSTLFARNNNFSGKIIIDIMPEILKLIKSKRYRIWSKNKRKNMYKL